ncbi:kinase-like domain-containing protein [Xylaria arbuscula]|nr:kinase-like domain-containing protein [Xylaria arbuscula]
MDNLHEHIRSIRRSTPNGPGYFIFPIGDLRQFWTKDKVDKLVGYRPLQDHEFKFLQDNLLRTLSLLIYIKEHPARVGALIDSFIRSGRDIDQILHLEENEFKSFVELILGDKEQHFFDVRPWFTALILKEGKDMNLEGIQGLPLIGNELELGSGMNGVVKGYDIAPGHLLTKNGSSAPETLVAVKTLHRTDAETEIRILRALRERLHDRDIQICACIMTVKEGDQVHSLSRRARGGNLRRKLEELQGQGFDRRSFIASMQQMKGIVGAIEFLHNTESNGPNTCYCHMDIKPDNILVFKESPGSTEERWQLIDFGITTISDMGETSTRGGARDESNSRHITITVGTAINAIASRYQPPEIIDNMKKLDLGESGNYMGRGSDIWSFACVFAEVVAANLGELNKLQSDINRFYEENEGLSFYKEIYARISKSKYRRHREFESWLKGLVEHGKRDPALKECYGLIEKMTHIERIKRLKSQQVLKRLNKSPTFGGER